MKNAIFECSILCWVEQQSVLQLSKNNTKIINIIFHYSYFVRVCFYVAIFSYCVYKVLAGERKLIQGAE